MYLSMKSILKVTIVLLAISSSIYAADDYPNSFESAQVIDTNTTINGDIETVGDIDIFKFTLTEKSIITFSYTTTEGTVGIKDWARIAVYDSALNLLNDIVVSREDTLRFGLESGEYYIRVYPWFNDITGYRFSTVENPFIDDFPNTFESAHLVEENTTINGNLEFFDDVDYFRFELTEPHNIELAYQSTVGDVGQTSSKILLYDNNQSKILDEYVDTYNDSSTITLQTGIYYLKMQTYYSDHTGYTFSVIYKPATVDDYANTQEDAHVIALDTTVSGNLEVSDDVDIFKFDLDQQATVDIELFSTHASIIKVFNNTTTFTSSLTSSYLYSFTLDPGTYFIQIKVNADITDYQVATTVKIPPVADDYPNALSSAKQIFFNHTINGSLEVINDMDAFMFEVDRNTSIEFDYKSIKTTNDWLSMGNISFYKSNTLVFKTWIKTYNQTQTLSLEPGIYQILIEPDNSTRIGYEFILKADNQMNLVPIVHYLLN